MKKVLKCLALIVLIMLISTICFATEVVTQEETEDTDAILKTSTGEEDMSYEDYLQYMQSLIQQGDVYQAGDDVTLDKIVDGNVYLVGNNVTVTSTELGGNLFIVGKSVTINSQAIYGSVYVVAEDLKIIAQTYDLYAVAENINVEKSYIARGTRICGEEVTLDGTFGSDIYSSANKLEISDDSSVTGKIYYSNEVSVPETMSEQLSKIDLPEKSSLKIPDALMLLTNLVTVIVLVFIVSLFMKEEGKYETDIRSNFIKDLLWGLLFAVLTPIILILIMVTGVLFPISLLLLAIYSLVLFVFALPVATIEFAKFILNTRAVSKGKVILAAIGLAVAIEILKYVPYVGAIISIVSTLYGFGFILRKLCKGQSCCCCAKSKKEDEEKSQAEAIVEAAEEVIEEKVEEAVETVTETAEEAVETVEEAAEETVEAITETVGAADEVIKEESKSKKKTKSKKSQDKK